MDFLSGHRLVGLHLRRRFSVLTGLRLFGLGLCRLLTALCECLDLVSELGQVIGVFLDTLLLRRVLAQGLNCLPDVLQGVPKAHCLVLGGHVIALGVLRDFPGQQRKKHFDLVDVIVLRRRD